MSTDTRIGQTKANEYSQAAFATEPGHLNLYALVFVLSETLSFLDPGNIDGNTTVRESV